MRGTLGQVGVGRCAGGSGRPGGWLLALVVVAVLIVGLVGCDGQQPAGGGGRGPMLGPGWPSAICDAVATCWPAPR